MKYLCILALTMLAAPAIQAGSILDNFPLDSQQNKIAAGRVCSKGQLDISAVDGIETCCAEAFAAPLHPQCEPGDLEGLCEGFWNAQCE